MSSQEENINVNTRITADAMTDLVDVAGEIAANTKKMSDLFTTQRTAVNNMGFHNRLQQGAMGQNMMMMRAMERLSRPVMTMAAKGGHELLAAGAGFLLHGQRQEAAQQQAKKQTQIPSFPATYTPYVRTLSGDFRKTAAAGTAAGTGTLNLGTMFSGWLEKRRQDKAMDEAGVPPLPRQKSPTLTEAMRIVAGGKESISAWIQKRSAERKATASAFATAPIPGAQAFQPTKPAAGSKWGKDNSDKEKDSGPGWASKLASFSKGALGIGSAVALIAKNTMFPGTASIGRNMEFYNEKMREGMENHPSQFLKGELARLNQLPGKGMELWPEDEHNKHFFNDDPNSGPHGLPGLPRKESQFNKEDDESHKTSVGAGIR